MGFSAGKGNGRRLEFITTKKWILKKGEDRNDTLHQGMPALVGMLLEAARYGDAI